MEPVLFAVITVLLGVVILLRAVVERLRTKKNGRWVIPAEQLLPDERGMGRRALQILVELGAALENNPRIQPDRKALLWDRAHRSAENVVDLLQQVARIRRQKSLLGTERQRRIRDMETRRLDQMWRSLDNLEEVLVSTFAVEVEGGDARIERLVDDLEDSNLRLRDMAQSYDEVRNVLRSGE
jgi:hypothetical protein